MMPVYKELFRAIGEDVHSKRDRVLVRRINRETDNVFDNEYYNCSICQACEWFSRRDLGKGTGDAFPVEWGDEL